MIRQCSDCQYWDIHSRYPEEQNKKKSTQIDKKNTELQAFEVRGLKKNRGVQILLAGECIYMNKFIKIKYTSLFKSNLQNKN